MTLFDLPDDCGAVLGDLQSVSGLSFLMEVNQIGSVKAIKAANCFRNLTAMRNASLEELTSCVGEPGADLASHRWNEIVAVSTPSEMKAICCFDDEWPEWLRKFVSAPAIIYVIGTMPTISCIAVVGTRHPTEFGLRVVDKVVEESSRRGWGVVSGLALGIDTAGHEKALQYGVPTWAILGGGVDTPTPVSNQDLAKRIVESGGGLISEQIPGTAPNPQRLVARNRLQAAASEIVLAAQCGIPSGTLHTVRFALMQGKRLVVPRPVGNWQHEPESAGNMALTDPNGCDPKILNAGIGLAKQILTRHPVADVVLTSDDIEKIWI